MIIILIIIAKDDDNDDDDCQLKIIPWRYRNIVLKIFLFFVKL